MSDNVAPRRRILRLRWIAVPLGVLASVCRADSSASSSRATQPLTTLRQAMSARQLTSESLTGAYIDAIRVQDAAGPALHSVISINPRALTEARQLDRAAAEGAAAGPLHGIPILIKDNIESADGTPTTAGSLALKDNVTRRDAFLVGRLRAAGAVILGKANLSEWANARSDRGISGWSAVGGLVKNPYVLDRSPCGSSAGSAAAVAAGFAAAAIGTETDGSITCPAAMNGLVGLKPTVGLVSRTHVIPISTSQDSPGPMTRTVEDAALILGAIAGTDPLDPATREADARRVDYAGALKAASLQGRRLGVLHALTGYDPATDAVFASAVLALRRAGADVVDIEDYRLPAQLSAAEEVVLKTELKVGLNVYLASTPAAVKTRTLADLIEFDRATPEETVLFGDEFFTAAQATHGMRDPGYVEARTTAKRLAGPEGIDALLARYRLDALIAPTTGPAWRSDRVLGDRSTKSASSLPAVAGYPHLTVPMGEVAGLPVGLSLMGAAWSEATLLQLGYAFEQITQARRPPGWKPSVDAPDRPGEGGSVATALRGPEPADFGAGQPAGRVMIAPGEWK